MYGPGNAPPPPRRPSDGALVGLRVLFSVLTFLSCGLLGWAAMLRLALVTRRPRDWFLFGLTLLLTVGLFIYAGTAPTNVKNEITDGAAVVILVWLILLIAGVLGIYLSLEVQHFNRLGTAPYGSAGTGGGYGYPGPAPATTPAPHHTPPPHQAPVHQPPAHQPPAHQPPTHQQIPAATPPPEPRQHPAAPQPPSHRIHQVRAELDELSDLLRQDRQDGRDSRREEEK
ncbi:hypothetical protein [Streptomyces sp. NPDC046887]|uniref:hypothetical protein n=1 Tax=Streptomyces sp. NPDC046887 TaxID=3155472 RepID=UPI0033FC3AB2